MSLISRFKRPKRWSLRSRLLKSYLTDRIDEQLYLLRDSVLELEPSRLGDGANLPSPRGKAFFDAYVLEFHAADGTLSSRYVGPSLGGAPDLPR